MSDKKIELIAQLLAKAESTTPEEAEALTEHAERLMIKYGIEQAIIDEKRSKAGQSSESIVTKKIQFNGAYRLDNLALGVSVLEGLGNLRALQSTMGNKIAWLHIIGFESDVEQAEILINSLQVQAAVAVRAWWKANKGDYQFEAAYDQEAARRSFVRGFGRGAGKRIAESRLQTVQAATTGTDLVLVSRGDKVDAHFDSISKRPSRARGGKGSGAAMGSGYAAGQNANTGGKSISSRKGISA